MKTNSIRSNDDCDSANLQKQIDTINTCIGSGYKTSVTSIIGADVENICKDDYGQKPLTTTIFNNTGCRTEKDGTGKNVVIPIQTQIDRCNTSINQMKDRADSTSLQSQINSIVNQVNNVNSYIGSGYKTSVTSIIGADVENICKDDYGQKPLTTTIFNNTGCRTEKDGTGKNVVIPIQTQIDRCNTSINQMKDRADSTSLQSQINSCSTQISSVSNRINYVNFITNVNNYNLSAGSEYIVLNGNPILSLPAITSQNEGYIIKVQNNSTLAVMIVTMFGPNRPNDKFLGCSNATNGNSQNTNSNIYLGPASTISLIAKFGMGWWLYNA